MHTDRYARCFGLIEQIRATHRLLGSGAPLATACTMAGRAESLLPRPLCPNQDEGVAAHVARDQARLTDGAILFRNCRVPSRESSCGSLAVTANTLPRPVDFIFFH